MITAGIGIVAGICYWFAWYNLAFWILLYAIVYGGLSALRGDSQTEPAYRGGSGAATAILVPVAWHVGVLAGYL
jgi:hypothetical protein